MGITAGITAGAAAISAGVGAYGVYTQNQGRQDATAAAQQQAQVSGLQAQMSAAFAGQEAGITGVAAQQSAAAAAASAGINKQIIGGELNLEAQRRQAMEVDAQRRQLEVVRQQQRSRALGLTNATAQGARFGTGLQGGYGQISGQTGVNMLGIQQNLQIGRNMFDINAGLSQQKIALMDLQTSYAQQQADTTTQLSQLKYQYAQGQAGLTTQFSQAGSQLATAQGQQAFGGSMVNLAQSIFAVGQVGARLAPSLFTPPTSGPMNINPTNSYSPQPYGFTGSGFAPGPQGLY